MAYVRGSPDDYNIWAKNGCDGWSYDDVLPYFKKSEYAPQPELDAGNYYYVGDMFGQLIRYISKLP